jgi:hypothetical protein
MRGLPPTRSRWRSTIKGILVAAAVFLLMTGLFRLIYGSGRPHRPAAASSQADADVRNLLSFTLKPGETAMAETSIHKNDALRYSWSTDGDELSFTLSGSEGRPFGPDQGDFSTLDATYRVRVTDRLRWTWRNRTSRSVAVTFETANGFSNFRLGGDTSPP